MIKEVYSRSLKVLAKKPIRLWGISLLGCFLSLVASALCGFAVPILGIAVTLLLGVSLDMVYLHGLRGDEVYAVQLFDCFKDWQTIKRVLAGMGWMILWIFLWALIPIVGIIFAIIKAYSYRLVPYILVHEPDVAPTEAIKVSTARTQGNKGKMFWSEVLPYLAIFAVSLVLGLFGKIPYVGVLFTIIQVLFTIVVAILMPLFLGLVKAAFYEKLSCKEEAAPEA